ncbi:MAG: hypothetical protein LBH37_02685 [Oscillospiraceae bacterium]|jgi:hypothetical protein|nr:hypothetical protein [Oscillospiraceae bacterium]
MEGQFNKIKKFKGVLLALMVAVAASISVTTGEFKDAHAAKKITPNHQSYERLHGYPGSGKYFFVSVSKNNNPPIVIRYTVTDGSTRKNRRTMCDFEVYTEVTSARKNVRCRC